MEPRKILIVDDEDSMRHMLALILRREGYEARAVGRGSEALALLEGEPFDFILSDVIMPEMGRVGPPAGDQGKKDRSHDHHDVGLRQPGHGG